MQEFELKLFELFAGVEKYLSKKGRILIGFSGGLDSTVLLTLACEYFTTKKVLAVHVNHGLSPNSKDWQRFVVEYCKRLSVGYSLQHVEIINSANQEAKAREARFDVFSKLIKKGDALLLGHHLDDQIETVLYRLLRGSGSLGLSGIPLDRNFREGRLFRPLITLTRTCILEIAQSRGLNWIEDETNSENRFDRNYLRNCVIPHIKTRWPNYQKRINTTIKLNKDAQMLAQSIFKDDLDNLDLRDERGGLSINLEKLKTLARSRQGNVIRYLPTLLGYPPTNYNVHNEFFSSFLAARIDGSPFLTCCGYQFRRFRNKVYVLHKNLSEIKASNFPITWDISSSLILPDGSMLEAVEVDSGGLQLPQTMSFDVDVKRGGERCRPSGRGRTQTLKKLFQEYSLEPWWRSHIPLLYCRCLLVAVGDLWICDGWKAHSGERGLKIIWKHNSV
ncbi:MAG: tRNA lysidine(34) synthetase TilS [Porticoccaceae bacterium]|nr:tRNA lysidine(34) synthetase TilS [Porticoccaceae bacterium]|tara:strand:- start:46777 stop:48117 length:1341 start_codon:yes stop_codon:yes gene_type:complete